MPTRIARTMTLALLLAGCLHLPPVADMRADVTSPDNGPKSATVPFRLDDNRVFVEVTFVKADGAERKALALVNMGSGAFVLNNALYRELDVTAGKPLHMKFGDMEIAMDGREVLPSSLANNLTLSLTPFSKQPSPEEAAKNLDDEMAQFAAPLPVEAVIPPGLLQHFDVAFDYRAKTMTLAAPGTLKPDGVAVPMRVDPQTGFATVDVTIDGAPRPFVIDDGGSYGIVRNVAPWLEAHPDWLRATGGVGEANYTMSALAPEAGEPVVRVDRASVGAVDLSGMGLIQWAGHGWAGHLVSDIFWDRIYSAKAGENVEGCICGNVLKSFRVTFDYLNRMSYWTREAPLDVHDLDQVGLVLSRANGVTTIADIATKNGAATVEGVMPGDKLVAIGGAATAPMTRGQLLLALHGTPGDRKHLTLERDGKRIDVDALVIGF